MSSSGPAFKRQPTSVTQTVPFTKALVDITTRSIQPPIYFHSMELERRRLYTIGGRQRSPLHPRMSRKPLQPKQEDQLHHAEYKWTKVRRQALQLIQSTGKRLGFPLTTMATAMVLFQRFYVYQTIKEFPPLDMALTALFVASKVEETVKKCRDIIVASWTCLHPDDAEPLSPDSEIVETYRKRVLLLEHALLETTCYQFDIRHPHHYMFTMIKQVQGTLTWAEKAWKILWDSYESPLVVLYPAHIIALACMYIAARYLERQPAAESIMEGDLGLPWWELFRVPLEWIHDASLWLLDSEEYNTDQVMVDLKIELNPIVHAWRVQHDAEWLESIRASNHRQKAGTSTSATPGISSSRTTPIEATEMSVETSSSTPLPTMPPPHQQPHSNQMQDVNPPTLSVESNSIAHASSDYTSRRTSIHNERRHNQAHHYSRNRGRGAYRNNSHRNEDRRDRYTARYPNHNRPNNRYRQSRSRSRTRSRSRSRRRHRSRSRSHSRTRHDSARSAGFADRGRRSGQPYSSRGRDRGRDRSLESFSSRSNSRRRSVSRRSRRSTTRSPKRGRDSSLAWSLSPSRSRSRSRSRKRGTQPRRQRQRSRSQTPRQDSHRTARTRHDRHPSSDSSSPSRSPARRSSTQRRYRQGTDRRRR